MKYAIEQVSPHTGGEYRRYLKRRLARALRRWAKKHPEDAPRKRYYRGYET